MAYLEELLPEFRKGAKIRCSNWEDYLYIYFKDGTIYGKDNKPLEDNKPLKYLLNDIYGWFYNPRWELYQEPIDWDYIIKNKCLCLFWDYNESKKHIGILKSINKYETYKFSIVTPDNYVSDISFVNCRPVRRDEVTFYEDRDDKK